MSSNTDAGNLAVVLNFDGAIYNSESISDFKLVHNINEVPRGTIKLIDANTTFVRNTTGNYGSFFFTNTTDGQQTEKYATYTFVVDSVNTEMITGSNTLFEINFHMGNEFQIQKETAAYTGPSSTVIEQIFKKRKSTVVNKITNPPTDTMTWRVIQDNLWESLDTIVGHSFKGNDYIYWCFDDVNNTWKISSFLTEMTEPAKYVILDNDNSINPTNNARTNLTSPPVTIWPSSQEYKRNELAKYKEDLFPNVSFSGFVDTKNQVANFRTNCFSEFLQSIGDNSQEKIKTLTQLNTSNLVFGNLKVLRHWPLNVHPMYSFSKVYRDYKIATYKAKVVTIRLNNTVGPPIGSKVAFITTRNDFRRNGLKLDEYYCANYIILSKSYEYGAEGPDKMGRDRPKSQPFITILTLYSDGLVDESNEMRDLFSKIGGDGVQR
jgi:hypothetical protein